MYDVKLFYYLNNTIKYSLTQSFIKFIMNLQILATCFDVLEPP